MQTNLIDRRSNLGKAISVIARAAVVLVLALPLSVAAQQRYELPAVLSASRILPAELLSGPNHRVQERVTNDGIVNIYKIDSQFGPFARTEMQRLNWKVYERNEALIVGTDKPVSYHRQDPRTPSAALSLRSKSIALGAGISWGDGTLNFQGKDYPFSVSELSLLDLGASTVTGTGRVYNLNNLSDFSGNYVATQATFAVAGGAGELTMTNARGVVISLSSQESGTQLTAGPSGISLKLN